ncbi:hypothetical protein KBC85_02635 [Candidatus Saccharibacteria bacterium]|nr:hypothetical protein [Candidatus Saccharibacteria bacterium]MDQ5885101.1 hypothetical protein [Patescibacteria group bacterium]MDQ5958212.1 hypothetical protein [Patescibacteria group bacterium]
MFTKTPVSMLLIIWMAGIIIFFNMFLGPLTKQLQTVKNINTQINSMSLQNPEESIVVNNYIDTDPVNYTPLAIFDNLLNK